MDENRKIHTAAIAWLIGPPLSTTLLPFISSGYVAIFVFVTFIIGIISIFFPIKLIGILSRSVAMFAIVGSFIGIIIVLINIGKNVQEELAQLRESNVAEYLERIKKRDEELWFSELEALNPEAFRIEQQQREEQAKQETSEIVKRTLIERFTGNAETVEQNIYVMGGATLFTEISEAGAYDPSTKIWTQNASIPTARAAAGSAVLDNDIYVIGGRAGNDVLSTCEKYIVREDRWEHCASMPTARWSLMLSAVDGKLYALGGISGVGNNRRALGIAEAYDPKTNSWEPLGKMPQVRQGGAVASIDGKIYIVSGKIGSYVESTTGEQITNRVDYFDPKAKRWTRVKDIPTGRVGSKAIVANDLIFIIGGITKSGSFPTTIDVFDPRANRWRSGPSLSSGRSGHMAALAGDSIFVFGGMNVEYGSGRPSILTTTESVSISEYQQ